jgi:hypothetical protein
MKHAIRRIPLVATGRRSAKALRKSKALRKAEANA